MAAPLESVIQIEGSVKGRKTKSKSSSTVSAVRPPHKLTGGALLTMQQDEVEIELTKSILLNPAEATLPFYSSNPELVSSLALSTAIELRVGKRRSTCTV